MIKRLTFFILALFISASAGTLLALEIPTRPDGYVTDRAGMFDAGTKERLEQVLRKHEDETTNQIFIATFPSLEGESLEDISIRLAETWKAGQKGKDNGVLVVIFRDDRKIRIEVGYGLEAVLPDALAGQIIRNVIGPRFAKGDYNEGILAGAFAIIDAVRKEPFSESKHGLKPAIKFTPIHAAAILVLFLLFLCGLTLIDIVSYKSYIYEHRIFKDVYNFPEWWIRFSCFLVLTRVLMEILYYIIIFGGRGMSSGGRGGGGSGGFGGGGGGSFGGGGSSGGW